MSHDILSRFGRHQRREILALEAKRRKTGYWPPWRIERFPLGVPNTSGWAAQFTKAHVNDVFSVLEREAGNGVRHFMVTSASQIRPTWPEMQRIKDEIAGEMFTAVEVYPAKPDIVDGADAYHLWVFPVRTLPFGLHL